MYIYSAVSMNFFFIIMLIIIHLINNISLNIYISNDISITHTCVCVEIYFFYTEKRTHFPFFNKYFFIYLELHNYFNKKSFTPTKNFFSSFKDIRKEYDYNFFVNIFCFIFLLIFKILIFLFFVFFSSN